VQCEPTLAQKGPTLAQKDPKLAEVAPPMVEEIAEVAEQPVETDELLPPVVVESQPADELTVERIPDPLSQAPVR
jgi:hypothetical protein